MHRATVASLCIPEGTKIQCLFNKHCLKIVSGFGNVLSSKSKQFTDYLRGYVCTYARMQVEEWFLASFLEPGFLSPTLAFLVV